MLAHGPGPSGAAPASSSACTGAKLPRCTVDTAEACPPAAAAVGLPPGRRAVLRCAGHGDDGSPGVSNAWASPLVP